MSGGLLGTVRGLLLSVVIFGASSAQSLELKRVILSSNDDPMYIEFWPIIAPIWTAMGFRPTLALIADEDCKIDESLGDIIRFSPIPDVSESLQAQVTRLFLPCLFPDDGCLISDIDMLPISRSYFVDWAEDCPDDGLLIYKDGATYWENRFPMCYVAGKGSCFISLFGVTNLEEMAALVQDWASLGYGWNTDELMLYDIALEWERNGGRLVRLGHDVGPRLDRGSWPKDFSHIDVSNYNDCHLPRPYSKYKASIDYIIQGVKEQLQNENR